MSDLTLECRVPGNVQQCSTLDFVCFDREPESSIPDDLRFGTHVGESMRSVSNLAVLYAENRLGFKWASGSLERVAVRV